MSNNSHHQNPPTNESHSITELHYEKNVMAILTPYNSSSISETLLQNNIILLAEAEAKAKAEELAKQKNKKQIDKLKNIYGF